MPIHRQKLWKPEAEVESDNISDEAKRRQITCDNPEKPTPMNCDTCKQRFIAHCPDCKQHLTGCTCDLHARIEDVKEQTIQRLFG